MDEVKWLEGFKVGLDCFEEGVEPSTVFVRDESGRIGIAGDLAKLCYGRNECELKRERVEVE
jgi:hypothetical protein